MYMLACVTPAWCIAATRLRSFWLASLQPVMMCPEWLFLTPCIRRVCNSVPCWFIGRGMGVMGPLVVHVVYTELHACVKADLHVRGKTLLLDCMCMSETGVICFAASAESG